MEQQQNNNTEMAKMLKKIEEMNQKETELKEKLDKKIVKMAEIEQKMKEEIGELKDQISEFLDEKRTLFGQFEEMKEQQKQSTNDESIIPIELMEQRKRAADKEESDDNLAIKKPKYSEKRIPNWLLEVLAWIKRTEMANSNLSTSSWTFKQLCWPKLHGNVEPYHVFPLGFYYQEEEFGNCRPILYQFRGVAGLNFRNSKHAKIIPIATVQPPEYILGFNEMHFWYLDGQLIQFMENVINKVKNIRLVPKKDMYGWEKSQILATHRLLATFSDKIINLDFNFNRTTTMYRPYRVRNSSYMHFENFSSFFPYIFDEAQDLSLIVDGDARADFIKNWLTKKRRLDGKHRLLWLHVDHEMQPQFVEKIKEEFEKATEPNPFLIVANSELNNLTEFTMENGKTGEVLTLYAKVQVYEDEDEEYLRHCIARIKKGDTNRKAQMEKYFFDQDDDYDDDLTEINLSIEKFGTFPNA